MSAIDAVGFVHLHVHTAFSLREGALTLTRLIDLAQKDQMPALAVTDTDNLFGALEFSEKAAKAGVQPIPGVQLTIDFGDGTQSAVGATDGRGHIVLIAQSERGYANLMRLASRAYLEPAQGEASHVSLDSLAANCEELIALTGGSEGGIDALFAKGRPEQARARLEMLLPLFDGRLYVEINATASTRSGASSRNCSISPIGAAFRWLRPTSPFSPRRRISRRMTRCSASPRAR